MPGMKAGKEGSIVKIATDRIGFAIVSEVAAPFFNLKMLFPSQNSTLYSSVSTVTSTALALAIAFSSTMSQV